MHHPDASPVIPPLPAESAALSGWLRRFGFRFAALYLVLYNGPALLGLVPLLGYVNWFFFQLWRKLVPWAGQAILHLDKPITILPNGSGDTTFNYVQVLCMLLVTFAGTLGWVWFDRKRRHDPLMLDFTRTVVRYALGMTMLSYGVSKMLHQQMPPPMLHQLTTPYSEMSPMGLLWRFMGYSAAYSFFAGFSECLGGLLLFFRRTTTLGALLLSAVMFHVVLMNFCFDVPVKLYSMHLFLFAVFLAAPDLGRLVDLLVRHRPVAAVPFARRWPKPWMRYTAIAIKVLLLGVILFQIPVAQFNRWVKTPPRPELYGLYDVQEFKSDDVILPASALTSARWRRLFITEYGVTVEFTSDQRAYYTASSSLPDHKLIFTTHDTPPRTIELTVTRPESDRLTIEGPFDNHKIAVELRRVDESKFLLLSRGFHWISEYPFNR